jgi:hypothetical protein
MYPHERSLVQKMKDRPFALLGVNTDHDRNEIKQVIKNEGINWRSWWNSPSNNIVDRWGVEAFPTIYLIDHQGVIRHEGLFGKELDDAIEKLVQEAENAR